MRVRLALPVLVALLGPIVPGTAASSVGQVEVVGVPATYRSSPSSSFTYWVAEIVNNSGIVVDDPQVTVDLLDPDGNVLGRDTEGTPLDGRLAVGARGVVAGMFETPAGFTRLRVANVTSPQARRPANNAFTISSSGVRRGEFTTEAFGDITNDNTVPAEFVRVQVVYRDSTGSPVASDYTFVDASSTSSTMQPAERATFTISSFGDLPAYSTADFVAAASSTPSRFEVGYAPAPRPRRTTFGTSLEHETSVFYRGTNGMPPGLGVRLEALTAGSSSWRVLTRATTSEYSPVRFPAVRVPYNATLRTANAAGGGAGAATSGTFRIDVAPVVTARLSATTVRPGTTVTLGGRVDAPRPGAPVRLQQLVNGAWRDVRSASLSGNSAYGFSVRHTARGTYVYRTARAADTLNLAGTSGAVRLTVR